MVERLPSPDDRRRNVVAATDMGRKTLVAADRRLAGAESELLAALDDDERDTLQALPHEAARVRVIRCSEGHRANARHAPGMPVGQPTRACSNARRRQSSTPRPNVPILETGLTNDSLVARIGTSRPPVRFAHPGLQHLGGASLSRIPARG